MCKQTKTDPLAACRWQASIPSDEPSTLTLEHFSYKTRQGGVRNFSRSGDGNTAVQHCWCLRSADSHTPDEGLPQKQQLASSYTKHLPRRGGNPINDIECPLRSCYEQSCINIRAPYMRGAPTQTTGNQGSWWPGTQQQGWAAPPRHQRSQRASSPDRGRGTGSPKFLRHGPPPRPSRGQSAWYTSGQECHNTMVLITHSCLTLHGGHSSLAWTPQRQISKQVKHSATGCPRHPAWRQRFPVFSSFSFSFPLAHHGFVTKPNNCSKKMTSYKYRGHYQATITCVGDVSLYITGISKTPMNNA